MWRNYLITALRNIARNRLTTFLSVLGLALGLTAAMFALTYVRHETTYDRFIAGNDRVYVMTMKIIGMVSDAVPAPVAAWMRTDYPGLEVARLMPTEQNVRHGELEVRETIGWADPNLFSLLRLPVLAGNLTTALENPDALVLTRHMARKYFGRDLPIGETLEINRTHVLRVAAVIEDFPAATHLAPEIYGSGRNRDLGLEPFDSKPYGGDINTDALTYVAISPIAGMTVADLQAAMPDFVRRHFRQVMERAKIDIDVELVRVADFHLHPGTIAQMKPHGSPSVLTAIGGAGLLIMLVAAINFVNLMTARSTRRAVEVGVRKTAGAVRPQLIQQFIGEAVLHAFAGLVLAGAAAYVLFPIIDANIAPGVLEEWRKPLAPVLAIVLAVVLGGLGGVYPAFILSSFQPARVLKGEIRSTGSGLLRQSLVLLQFSVLITLVLATMVIYRQTTFALRDGLRISSNQMLLLYGECDDTLIHELGSVDGIQGLACSTRDPVDPIGFTTVHRGGGAPINMGIGGIGFGFLELYGIQPLAGRFFDPRRDPKMILYDETHHELRQVVINQAAVHAFGFAAPEDAIGQTFTVIDNGGQNPVEIIGVAPDFSFDLKTMQIPPSMYTGMRVSSDPVISLRLSGAEIPETLKAIDAIWKRVGEPRPVHRIFVDQELQAIYLQTTRQGRLIGALCATAILIACLGLFGLSAFAAEQRTKEIGIRKAMGATKRDILGLLLWQFTKPVLWANLIAWPAAYFIMRRWLEGFAYHIDLAPWMFIAASALALLIAVATVIGHALLVARAKPVTALRYE